MRFSTLAHLIADEYYGYGARCPCGDSTTGYHASCNARMPYNWVVPHNSTWCLQRVRERTQTPNGKEYKLEAYPPPVNFQGGQ